MSRFGYVMATYCAAIATIIAVFINPPPRLIWNASASVPIGLYAVRARHAPKVGDLVAVAPPPPLARFLAERHYLPRGVPLLKPVAAVAGQRVCRTGPRISVDGTPLGEAQARDRRRRILPAWRGCRTLAAGDVFLMNPRVSDSFDGRYFGPLPDTTIIGAVTPVWIVSPRARHAPAPAPAR